MRKKIHIPYNKNNHLYYYSCPYFGSFVNITSHPFKIPSCKTATALTIYYHIFFPDSSIKETNTKPFPLWRYILWLKEYDLQITNDFAKLMYFLCQCPFRSLPQKGYKHYNKKREFYAEARYFILSSHEWDWVVPHLRKTYPQLIFGDFT